MTAPSSAPPRPNLVLTGTIRGVVLGVLLTILGTVLLIAITFLTTPDIDEELAGYLLFFIPPFACAIAIVPMVIGGAIVGVGLGMFYQRQSHRLTGSAPVLIGVMAGMVLFILLFGVGYIMWGGSPLTQTGTLNVRTNLEMALWVSPFFLLMIIGYGWLSNQLNKRVPQ